MTTTLRSIVFALALGLAACGGEQRQERGGEGAGAFADTGGRMGGMPGMGSMMDTTMMQGMRDRMQMMAGASADSMQAMLPEHRQMTANMLAQMNREMAQMSMTGDSVWTATVDSLRQDLTRMPEMGPAELKALMPAHQARAIRLMELHRTMMQKMGM